MNRLERGIVLWSLSYMATYVPISLAAMLLLDPQVAVRVGVFPDEVFPWIVPFHFLGMAQNLVALVITMRDLYRRPFPNVNDKVTWTQLILCTGGIG